MSSFQAIEVFLNGRPLLMAGAPDALLISLHVSVLINSTDAATLHVSGMRDLGKARQSHVQWLDELALAGGDELRMRLASVHRATPPTEDIATDSDEHLAAHASYEAEMVANPPKVSELHRKRPEGTLEVMVNGGAPIVAHFTGGRDLLMLGAT